MNYRLLLYVEAFLAKLPHAQINTLPLQVT